MKRIAYTFTLVALALTSNSCDLANASEPATTPTNSSNPSNPGGQNNSGQGGGGPQLVSFYVDSTISPGFPMTVGTTPSGGTFVLTDVIADIAGTPLKILADGAPVLRVPYVPGQHDQVHLVSGIPIPADAVLTAEGSETGLTISGYVQ